MGTDLDAFAIAAYVRIDDFLKDRPDLAQPRPTTGITPKLSDAELLTLAIIQAMLGFRSEHHFIRYPHTHLIDMFPNMCGQSGYNKRYATAGLARLCEIADAVGLRARETGEIWPSTSGVTWALMATALCRRREARDGGGETCGRLPIRKPAPGSR